MIEFQSVGKISYEVRLVWESPLSWLVCTALVFASKRNHHWNCNLQSGHTWVSLAHTLFLLGVDVPLVFLTWRVLAFSGNKDWLYVSKLMASFMLEFLCRTLKSFHMGGISTLWTPIFILVHISWIKALLVVTWCMGIVLNSMLVTWLFWFNIRFFLLVLSWWYFCVLMPHQTDLHSLWVTSHLLDMVCSCLGAFHFLDKLSYFTSWKFLKIHITIIDGLGYKFLIMQEKPKDVTMQDLCCFWGAFSQIDLSVYCIIPFIHASIASPEACKQIKVGAHFIGLWFAEFLIFPKIVSRLRSSFYKPQDTYWCIPKSPIQAISFLQFLHSGRAASSHSRIFWHFKHHFKNLVESSLTSPVHLGTFYVWHEHAMNCLLCPRWLEWDFWVKFLIYIFDLSLLFLLGHLELLTLHLTSCVFHGQTFE